jgi:chaperonin cofactor prefoldin
MNFKERVIAERQELYRKKDELEKELKQLLEQCRNKRKEIEEIKKEINKKYAILGRLDKKSGAPSSV